MNVWPLLLGFIAALVAFGVLAWVSRESALDRARLQPPRQRRAARRRRRT